METEKKTIGMTTAEKVAYLRGLADGMDIRADSREGKVLYVVLDVLEELAADADSLSEDNREIWETLDNLNDNIADLNEIAGDDGFSACCGCGQCGEDEDEDELLGLEDEPDDFTYDLPAEAEAEPEFPAHEDAPAHALFYEVQCPVCSECITLEESVLAQGYIVCPKCGERLEFDMSDDEAEPESLPEYDYPDEAELTRPETEE